MSITSFKNKTISSKLLVGNEGFVPNSYESIATVTVGSGGTTNIDFTSIPSTFKHLQVRAILQQSTPDQGIMTFNNSKVSGTYYTHYLRGDGSAANAGGQSSDVIKWSPYGTTSSGSTFNVMVMDILDYASTNKNKVVRVLSGKDTNGAGDISLVSGVWLDTSAINQITFLGQGAWNQYSKFALYGIKG